MRRGAKRMGDHRFLVVSGLSHFGTAAPCPCPAMAECKSDQPFPSEASERGSVTLLQQQQSSHHTQNDQAGFKQGTDLA